MSLDPAVQPRTAQRACALLGDTQIGTLFGILADALDRGAWLTLDELADRADACGASVSAQIRNLRKPQYGSHTIEKRRRVEGAAPHGYLWEYRLVR